MMIPAHKTRIVATIGPTSHTLPTMEAMLRAGMNIARINFSHGRFEDHAKLIHRLRQAAQNTGIRLAIMADLPGPKIRIGEMEHPVELKRGDPFVLTTKPILGNQQKVSVSLTSLPRIVHPGTLLFLNDGIISLEVESIENEEVHCRVRSGGELSSRKGLNLPGVDLGFGAFTPDDEKCLEFALQQGVDAISQSFVARAQDLIDLRAAMQRMGKQAFVIAKIERKSALEHLDEILEQADGIMIARGDLGVEIPISNIAMVQKSLMRRANELGKPVITATQMLESMIHTPRPTRAEATDVANAIIDGTDAIMLSAESAVGRYPVESVAMLAQIAKDTEKAIPPLSAEEGARLYEENSIVDLIAQCVQQAVHTLHPVCVVVPTRSGNTARNIARYRLPVWIMALSIHHETCQHLQFTRGVFPAQVEREQQNWAPHALEWLRTKQYTTGTVVLTQGPSPAAPHAPHRMEIAQL